MSRTERDHWLSITDDPNWRRNHIADPNIPIDATLNAITCAFPDNPARIIEIGCGYGRLTTRIAALYPTATVTGIDINPMILPPQDSGTIRYRCTDTLTTDTTVDAIYSVAVFQHLTRIEKFDYITQSHAALTSGGVLRIQFIDGERDNFCDHWAPTEDMESWFVSAGFGVSAVDAGLAHPQWTWITGIK